MTSIRITVIIVKPKNVYITNNNDCTI